jgi:hypothetical protein
MEAMDESATGSVNLFRGPCAAAENPGEVKVPPARTRVSR